MRVYYMNVSGIDPDDKKWQKYISKRRADKVARLKSRRHRAQSIGAELLLNYAVNGDIKKIVVWDTDEDGKLYLTERDRFYVNLSHSGDYAVCAKSRAPIGADIQRMGKSDIKIADRFFTPEEAEYIKKSADETGAFYEIWTKKESLVKAAGKGLTVPLSSFCVLSDIVRYDGKTYGFKEYSVGDDGYKLFVCVLL